MPPPQDRDNDEIGWDFHLVTVIMRQGYERSDGTVGIYDAATGLPLTFERHHPLKCSPAAHARHGQPFVLPAALNETGSDKSTSQRPNIATESWSMNKFRGSRRFAALVGVIKYMLPTLQQLRDDLLAHGLFKRHRQLKPISLSSPVAQLWADNKRHPLELALLDPGRAPRLRRDLEAAHSGRGHRGAVESCKQCALPREKVEQAERASVIISSCPHLHSLRYHSEAGSDLCFLQEEGRDSLDSS